MPLAFPDWELELLDGSIVGVTGDPAQIAKLAERADGQAHVAASSFHQPEAGRVERAVRAALESSAPAVAIGPGLSLATPEFQARARLDCIRAARAGRLVVLASQDLGFLEGVCDEIIVLGEQGVERRGDPHETVALLRAGIGESLRAHAGSAELPGYARRGDGRARLISLELLGENAAPTAVVRSGESCEVRIALEFLGDVAEPVVGILIRNRVGVTVYGTNTELEKLRFGPCSAGDSVELSFRFACDLCAHEYTLTAASHDPDGTAHDWLEEVLLFTVTDDRPTAGVANLRARATARRQG